MSGRRDDSERIDRHGSSPDETPTGSWHLDLLSEVLREEPELAAAVGSLPAALDPVDLPDGAWARLTGALVAVSPTAAYDQAGSGAATGTAADDRPPHSPAHDRVGLGGSRERRPGWNWAHPFTWLSAAAVAAVVIGLGTWGALQAQERARLGDEQRVLAYWMANPDLRMVALQEIGSSDRPGSVEPSGRLGVVCILPDGRALLLQPTQAGRGRSYVVLGREGDSAGAEATDTVLGSGTSNVIRFDLGSAERVVVMLTAADGEQVPIAWAAVN